MMNSPGLTLFAFSAAAALSRKLNKFDRRRVARQIVGHVFVFFMTLFLTAGLIVMAVCFEYIR
jgi:hypothetical protein